MSRLFSEAPGKYRWCVRIIAGITLYCWLGCDPPPASTRGALWSSSLRPIVPATTIRFNGSFSPSGVGSPGTCDIVLVGRAWGTIARVRADGTVDSLTGRLPHSNKNSSLETGPAEDLLVWTADDPQTIGWVRDDLSVDTIVLPEHPWGGRRVGPTVPLTERSLATAALSHRRRAVQSPNPWVDAPLVQVLDERGGELASLGTVPHVDGQFRSWAYSRSVVGASADAVFVVNLTTATLSVFPARLWSTGQPSQEFMLQTYFELPEFVEEVAEVPWLTVGRVGGERVNMIDARHMETAAFGKNRIYSIANYAVEWLRFKRERFSAKGGWDVVDQGLDIFNLSGRRLASYQLPEPDPPNWLRADRRGRIFLKYPGKLHVLQDPTFDGAACPSLPDTVVVTLTDTAPRYSESDFPTRGEMR